MTYYIYIYIIICIYIYISSFSCSSTSLGSQKIYCSTVLAVFWSSSEHQEKRISTTIQRRNMPRRCRCWILFVADAGYTLPIIWLVVSNMFISRIFGIVIPIDFHIFQSGWNHQPVFGSVQTPSGIAAYGTTGGYWRQSPPLPVIYVEMALKWAWWLYLWVHED